MHLGLRRKQTPHALTASATRASAKTSASMRRLVQPQQERALGYYNVLGPIKYAGNFYSRSLMQLRIFPAFKDENGEPQETEDKKVRELLDRVQDPNGGRSNLFGTYGRLRFLTGESYLTCSYDEDVGEKWEMLSMRELQINGNGSYTRMAAPGLGAVELKALPDDESTPREGTIIVYRLWRPSPEYSELADASMFGVLEDCEELLLLQAAVRARVRSRLAGPGLLVIADDISPPPPEPIGDENMAADPFYEDLIEGITTPIAEEGSAAAQVPVLLRVAADRVKDGFNFISFRDSNEEYREVALRDEALKRIAIGLDMPPEVLTGTADVNHWGSWQIDEQTFKAHIQPVCQELCDDLTSAYLRPAARDAGIANWENLVVDYDAAGIINHPDRAKDAKELYSLRAISKAALRDACNFDDDDAMPEDERAELVGIATRDPSLAWYGIPSVKAGGIEPTPGVIEDGQGTDSAPTGPATGAEVEPGPPPNAPPDTNVASAMILGACDMAVERSRSLAGSRIRTRANNGCQECKERLLQVPQRLVASTLGPEMVSGLNAPTDRELVAGGADDLVQTLTRWGIAGERARAIGDQVESHAARTLYELEPAPLPSGFAAFVARLSGPVAVAA